MRAGVCEYLTCIGVEFDDRRNREYKQGNGEISADGSKVRVFVIPTNEELVIARDTQNIVKKL